MRSTILAVLVVAAVFGSGFLLGTTCKLRDDKQMLDAAADSVRKARLQLEADARLIAAYEREADRIHRLSNAPEYLGRLDNNLQPTTRQPHSKRPAQEDCNRGVRENLEVWGARVTE